MDWNGPTALTEAQETSAASMIKLVRAMVARVQDAADDVATSKWQAFLVWATVADQPPDLRGVVTGFSVATEKWVSDLDMKVRWGTETWESWAAQGMAIGKDAAAMLDAVFDTNMWKVLTDSVHATIVEVKQALVAAAQAAADFDPTSTLKTVLYIAGGVLVLYGLVVIWPARKAVKRAFGGARRRSRR